MKECLMKLNGNEIRPGNVLNYQNSLWRAVKVMAVKPGKGGAYAQVEMKNLFDGRKLNQRFRASETVERVTLEQRDFTYLYLSEDMLVFMDTETFDQVELSRDFLSDDEFSFLEENMTVTLERHEERYINCQLPSQIICIITETEPVVKGQTATSSYKPAILHNGVRITVPQFVKTDEKVVVSTVDMAYIKRADA
ncbi:MAG: elongation factor P [Alphaproteobacteria bacterium]|jgi:elongation factor P